MSAAERRAKERNIKITLDDLVPMSVVPDINLPDIEAESAYRPEGNQHYMLLLCKPKNKYSGACPLCGCVGTEFKGYGYLKQPRLVHDVPVGTDSVDLYVKTPRYVCRDCGGIFTRSFESISDGKQCTLRLIEKIKRDCFSRPFSDIAAETGYTIPTISSIFDEYIEELDASRPPIVAPEVLGIDEKHIVHQMRAVFIDDKTGSLLEMLPSNKADDIISMIESMVDYDKNIRIVTMDMANGYKSAVQMCLPYAKIVVDKFHVFQDLTRRITKAKTGIMEEINLQIKGEPDKEVADHLREVRDLIVRNAYLFKFGRKKLTEKPERIKVMADACQTFPELNHLRLIKEGFERIYEEAETREQAESLYAEWEKLIPPSGKKQISEWEAKYHVQASFFKELTGFYRTTKNWHEEIFAYFDEDCAFTNAAAEGTNSLIQRINAQGSGYGFNHLRAKAVYWHRSGARIAYRLDTTKKPIYGSAVPSKTDTHTKQLATGFSDIDSLFKPKITGYQEYSCIKAEEIISKRSPISVFQYIDDSALYYDFSEDE